MLFSSNTRVLHLQAQHPGSNQNDLRLETFYLSDSVPFCLAMRITRYFDIMIPFGPFAIFLSTVHVVLGLPSSTLPDGSDLVVRNTTIGACRNVPGNRLFPTSADWAKLNSTIGGRLQAVVPFVEFCRTLANQTCSVQQYTSSQFRLNVPGAMNQVSLLVGFHLRVV